MSDPSIQVLAQVLLIVIGLFSFCLGFSLGVKLNQLCNRKS